MKAQDVLDLATRNLRESILRNSLTTLGIAVGVASLVAMLSLGIGLQQLANKRLSSSTLDTVFVFSRQEFRFGHDDGPKKPGRAESRPLDETVRAEIQRLPKVKEVFPELRFATEIRYNDKLAMTSVAGLPQSARENESFDTAQGSFFSSENADEALLISDFAKQLDPNTVELVGKEIVLRYAERQPLNNSSTSTDPAGFSIVRREQKLRIAGIIEQDPYGGFRGLRAGVFLPIRLAESLNVVQTADLRSMVQASTTQKTYSGLRVRVSSPTHVQGVEDAVRKMGFSTYSLLDMMRNMRRFFAVLDLFLGIFGSLALVVASLGIINTLVMAILERRREIGIMKAIGASDGDVQRLFFAEAGTMGIVGGVLGVALGWAIGRIINFGSNIYLQRQNLPTENVWSVPWWLVAGAIAFSIIVTLLSGLYPASRAAKLDPVQALRYE